MAKATSGRNSPNEISKQVPPRDAGTRVPSVGFFQHVRPTEAPSPPPFRVRLKWRHPLSAASEDLLSLWTYRGLFCYPGPLPSMPGYGGDLSRKGRFVRSKQITLPFTYGGVVIPPPHPPPPQCPPPPPPPRPPLRPPPSPSLLGPADHGD